MEQLTGGVVDAELAAVSAAVDVFLDGLAERLSRGAAADVVASVHALESVKRRLASADHALIAALESRSIPAVAGCASTSVFLQVALRLSPGEAAGRVRAAELVGERRSVTGAVLQPLLPVVAKAQAAGELSPEHVNAIVRVVTAFPVEVSVEDLRFAEEQLVTVAGQARPGEVVKVGQRLQAWLDPDGDDERDRVQHKRRELALTERADGMSVLRGVLTPACAAVVQAALTPRSAPRPAGDGTRDLRTGGQRLHDALEELAGVAVRRNELTDSGAPATVIITMTDQQYRDGHGVVETSFGHQLTPSQALRLADEAVLIGLVTNANGEVLKLGRAKRVASRVQTLALIARDGGCSFPDCDRPPEHCQRHHVIPWYRGGDTDVGNLTLLCGYHHRIFESLGYVCTMRDGLPEWTPPPWIDPAQTPRMNPRIRRPAMC